VDIERVESVGNYAIRPIFSDGHDSGLYSWDLLYNLGRNHATLWQAYLDRLQLAGASRDAARSDAPPCPAGAGRGGAATPSRSHQHWPSRLLAAAGSPDEDSFPGLER